jgi:hypothetical protein
MAGANVRGSDLGMALVQGAQAWKEHIPPPQAALLICDMWDRHYCTAAMSRIDILAPRVDRFSGFLRMAGASIIHAPSGVVGAYDGHPARNYASDLPVPADRQVELPPLPPLPIDDSNGGCPDTPRCEPVRNRTAQHPRLTISAGDFICDTQAEVLGILGAQSVARVLVCGVHLNMCVLNRPFGLRALQVLGRRPVLVRDLVDVMYDPGSPPYISHGTANEMVRRFIEEHVCPSVSSESVTRTDERTRQRTSPARPVPGKPWHRP